MTDRTSGTEKTDQLLDDHRSLMLRITELREYIDQVSERGIPQFAELGARMHLLRDDLATHFSMEERGGYLSEALAAAPDRTAEAEELCEQHEQILQSLEELAVRLRDCEPPFESWQEACDLFNAVLSKLRLHEGLETALVQSAFEGRDSEALAELHRTEGTMMDANELVTVYTLNDANRAELIKSELQALGIACRIDGENQAGLSHVLEIGIMVRAKQADEARRFIERHEERGSGA